MTDYEIPHVPSPYEGKRLRVRDHLSISAFWFGSNVLWAAFLAIILPKQMEDMGGARASVLGGQVLGISALIALVVPLLSGPISDRSHSRFGRRRPFIVIGVLITFLGLSLVYFAAQGKAFYLYMAGFLVMQLGANIATGAYQGVIPDLVPDAQRGVASGWMAAMTQLGTAVGVVAAGLLLDKTPALAFLVIVLMLVLSVLATVFGIRENPLTRPVTFNWKRYLKSLWIDPKTHRDFFWVWITRALVMLGFYIVQPNLLYYLRDVIRAPDPTKAAMTIMLLVLVAATLTGLWGGHISDRTGRKKIVYIANGIMALAAILFPFCRSMESAAAMATFFGLGYGAYVSVDWALGTDVLPDKKHAGKDMAVWHVAMVLPQSLSAPIAGYLLYSFGHWTTKDALGQPVDHYYQVGYQVIFGVAAVFLTLGAILLRNVRGAR